MKAEDKLYTFIDIFAESALLWWYRLCFRHRIRVLHNRKYCSIFEQYRMEAAVAAAAVSFIGVPPPSTTTLKTLLVA